MPVLLFVILFSLSAFATEVVDSADVHSEKIQEEVLQPEAVTDSAVDSVASLQTGPATIDSSGPFSDSSAILSQASAVHDSVAIPAADTVTIAAPATDTAAVDSVAEPPQLAADTAPSASVDSSLAANAPYRNIPLPRQTAYTGKGLSVGIGAGIYNPSEDCDCMGIWQIQLEYFYTDWISAGIDARFFGGDLDSDVMIMYQRYRLNARLHKAWQNFDMFLEPVFGLENTSISEFRDQFENRHSSSLHGGWGPGIAAGDSSATDTLEHEPVESCEKMFSLDGFSVGIGAGLGVNLSSYFGLTGSVLYEYNFSGAMLLTLTPGVAFNLGKVWPWARKNLRSAWISFEFGAQRYYNRGVRDWATHGFLGGQLGI